MKIEELCDYLEEIGMIDDDTIESFLEIYMQYETGKKSSKIFQKTLSEYLFNLLSIEENYDLFSKKIISKCERNLAIKKYAALNRMFNAVNRPYQSQVFGTFYQLKTWTTKQLFSGSQIELGNSAFGRCSQLFNDDIVEQMSPQLNQKTIKNICEKIRPNNQPKISSQRNWYESNVNKLTISSNHHKSGRRKRGYVEMNSFEQYNPRIRSKDKPVTQSYRDSTNTLNVKELKTINSYGNILNGKSILNQKENKLLNQLKKEHDIKFKRTQAKDYSSSNSNYNSHHKHKFDPFLKKEEETKIIYNKKIAYVSGTSRFLDDI